MSGYLQQRQGLPKWTLAYPELRARCESDECFKLRVLSAEGGEMRQRVVRAARVWAERQVPRRVATDG